MFDELTNLSHQRTKKQALGFYLTYSLFSLLTAFILSTLYVLINPALMDDLGQIQRFGHIIGIVFSLMMALLVVVSKENWNAKSIA